MKNTLLLKKILKLTEFKINDKNQFIELYELYKDKNTINKNFVISADEIKKLFSDYNPNISGSLQKESGILAQRFYEYSIKNEDYKNVVLTAGGPASGKTEIIVNSLLKNKEQLIFDSTLKNYNTLIKNYDLAFNHGKRVLIIAMLIDINNAFLFSTKRKRKISQDAFIEAHLLYRKTLLELIKSNINYNIEVLFNDNYSIYKLNIDNLDSFLSNLKLSESEGNSINPDYLMNNISNQIKPLINIFWDVLKGKREYSIEYSKL